MAEREYKRKEVLIGGGEKIEERQEVTDEEKEKNMN